MSDLQSAIPVNMLQAFKSDLLILMVLKAGGEVHIPATEVDGMGKYILTCELNADQTGFILRTQQKS